MNLPSGVVTFLMTDIEGSTRLWAEAPDAMRVALARHDAIASAAISEYAGVLIKARGEGDSTFSVFVRPTDAVAAARELQTALTDEPWPEGAPLRVRVAVHTGEADVGVDDYYGIAVNRCARLRSIAHGGQVLVSEATAGLVRELLPEEVALRDLGFQRLRDLAEPERVSQLLHPSLPTDFPALRTIDLIPNNLPYQVSTFVGREAEMTRIRELLRDTRLLTLTGAGGVGKTRLALQAAAEMLYEYPDGVWLVELESLSDGGLVHQALATVLDVREEPGTRLADALVARLRAKQALLVLDNCEHLVEACAELAEHLTRQCQAIRILATSREALRAEGETTWRVPSLSVPHRTPGVELQPEQLTQYAAVRLFVDRATKVSPGFAMTNRNAPSVAEICSRLEGVPLAIELAAARANVLSPEQIEQRLDERFRLLTGGRRTALPRQQTLEATVRWSYELLPEPEQRLFARLSVFAGGFVLEAAEAVCAGDGIEPWDIPELLGELASKSLVIPGGSRYWMLQTLRSYGAQRLDESGEAQATRQRHAEFYARRAVEVNPLFWSPKAEASLAWCEMEHANFRAALAWTLEHDVGLGLRLASAFARVWEVGPHWREGRDWFAKLLSSEGSTEPSLRANALFWTGGLARDQGDYGAARELLQEALELHRQLGDRLSEARDLLSLGHVAAYQGDYEAARAVMEQSLAIYEQKGARSNNIARSLHSLGWVAQEQGDGDSARSYYRRSLALYREEDDRRSAAVVLNNLGNLAADEGDYEAAIALHEEGLALSREIGDRTGVSLLLNSMGHAAGTQGDHGRARALCQEALEIARELGARLLTARSLRGLARAAAHVGTHREAGEYYREALALSAEMGGKLLIADCLDGLAALASQQGQAERAATLFGTADALRRSIGAPTDSDDLASDAEQRKAAHDALGEDAFRAAWEAGAALSLEDAVAEALEVSDLAVTSS